LGQRTGALNQTYPAEVFVRADVRDLAPFSDKQFDYVQACNVLDYVPEMRRAIEAAHRVTRANGFFVFLIPEQNLIEGHAEIAVSVHTSVTGKYWPDKASVPSVSVGRETLTEMLKSVGFQPREIQFTEPLSRRPCTWWVCRRL
jgi:ubiquinone/menaquinone biosynthesis C-methylase UbiE